MKKITEKGQALILVAFGIVGLIALTALTIDGARVYEDRRHAQNAADTAALAAALDKIQNPTAETYKNIGYDRALSNGYAQSTAKSQVVINLCSEVSGANACTLPTGANADEYIRVRITSIVDTTFAKVIGRDQLTNEVEAITRVQGTTSSGSFFNGAGMVAVKNTNENQCLLINGNANITYHNTGVFVNCTGSEALFINGGAQVGLEANANVAGCAKNQGGNVTGVGTIQCNQPQQTVNASTFAKVPRAPSTPTCPTNAPSPVTVGDVKTFQPGNYPASQTVNSNQTGVLQGPGTFCFTGGLNINGSGTLQGIDDVKIVLGANDLNLNNTTTFSDVEIFVTSGKLSIKGDFTASERLRFYATGSGGMDVQSGTTQSPNAYLYSENGLIQWNAQSTLLLTAPPQDDPFKIGGLLIHMPWENGNDFILNGGTNSILTGTILVPKSEVTYNGNSGFELHGQVIGYTFKVNGGGHTDIYFEASENYNPGGDPTIEFTW